MSVGTPASEPLNLNRTPTGAFADPRLEEYAQRRAAGAPPAEAALHSGFGRPLTSRLENTQELHQRLQEIQSEGAEKISLLWIVRQAMKNVYEGRNQRSVKSSTDALIFLYEVLTKHKDELEKAGAASIVREGEELAQRRGALRGQLAVMNGGSSGQKEKG